MNTFVLCSLLISGAALVSSYDVNIKERTADVYQKWKNMEDALSAVTEACKVCFETNLSDRKNTGTSLPDILPPVVAGKKLKMHAMFTWNLNPSITGEKYFQVYRSDRSEDLRMTNCLYPFVETHDPKILPTNFDDVVDAAIEKFYAKNAEDKELTVKPIIHSAIVGIVDKDGGEYSGMYLCVQVVTIE